MHRQHVTIFATQLTTIQDRAQNRKKKKNLTVKVVTGKPCLLLMKNSLIGIREIKIHKPKNLNENLVIKPWYSNPIKTLS